MNLATKCVSLAAAAWALTFSGSADAQAAPDAKSSILLTSNLALTSNYVWRYVSQSNKHPAIQGGFDLTNRSKGYVGVWASNVDFNDASDANLEVDLYGGYRFDLAGVGLDVGAIYYAYPDAGSGGLNSWEVYGKAKKDIGRLGLSSGINIDPKNNAIYGEVAAALAVTGAFSLNASLGNYLRGAGEYMGWSAGASYTVAGAALSLSYSESDLGGAKGDLSFAISKSF